MYDFVNVVIIGVSIPNQIQIPNWVESNRGFNRQRNCIVVVYTDFYSTNITIFPWEIVFGPVW